MPSSGQGVGCDRGFGGGGARARAGPAFAAFTLPSCPVSGEGMGEEACARLGCFPFGCAVGLVCSRRMPFRVTGSGPNQGEMKTGATEMKVFFLRRS